MPRFYTALRYLGILLLVGGGIIVYQRLAMPPVLANGGIAPDFTVQSSTGAPIRLSDYQGKTVVLDFWATWCEPCQEALPGTNTLAREYAGKNVVFLAVNVWDTPDAFAAWLPKHAGLNALTFAIDPAPQGGDTAAQYKVSAIPTQFVINPQGRITASFIGGYQLGDFTLKKAIFDAQKT